MNLRFIPSQERKEEMIMKRKTNVIKNAAGAVKRSARVKATASMYETLWGSNPYKDRGKARR